MPDSYIAKYNVKTQTVEETIDLPGGPEGVEISNGKLYAALNYKDSVAVITLDNQAISYIVTPAVSSYFLKDQSGNLYVSLVSTWSDFSTETGLGYINTSTDELTAVYNLPDVSYEYASIMAANADQSKIYVVTTETDENWVVTGAVSVFDVATKTFASEKLISGISGPRGLTVNPNDGNIYLFTGESVTGAGLMKIYNPSGELQGQKTVGASPAMALFLD
jgi:DNA-binding beta-propeller fold protein YncE